MFVMRELIERDRHPRARHRRLLARRQPGAEARGRAGDAAPPELRAVCAVSPTMDLAVCVDALERRSNLRLPVELRPQPEGADAAEGGGLSRATIAVEPLRRVWTVRQFDEAYTAPHHGFRDAADYYYRASAIRVIDQIRVPTLILTAEDDPFVPSDPFQRSGGDRQPAHHGRDHAATAATAHSSSRAAGDYDGYWAEREIVRFATLTRPETSTRCTVHEPALGLDAPEPPAATCSASCPSTAARTPALSLPLRA